MEQISSPRTTRRRRSYADRTGASSRAAAAIASVFAKREMVENDAGDLVPVWGKKDAFSFTNEAIRLALSNRLACDEAELLAQIPPAAIKYSITKGWLRPNASRTLFFVTCQAAADLDLPRRFKGGLMHGRAIKFQL